MAALHWGAVASPDTYLPIEEAVEDGHHQPLPEGAGLVRFGQLDLRLTPLTSPAQVPHTPAQGFLPHLCRLRE